MKIAYITDSGTGSSKEELAKNGIYSLPLQITVDNKSYQDIEEFSHLDLIENLKQNKTIQTSLPSLGKIENLFEELKTQKYDKIIAIPICSGLSGTINALQLASNDIGIDISCIDTYTTAVIQEYLITYVSKSIKKGIKEENIIKQINECINSCNTLLIPDDLNHLKKCGRLTPIASTLAGLLKIKPILTINKKTNGKIDVLDKVRTYHKAIDKAIEEMKNDINSDEYHIYIAHVDALNKANELKQKLIDIFPSNTIQIIPLCSPVAAHTGLGCIAIQYFKALK